jgi:GrpB-like predicted nucleotidyltransferase (UPF0157 family)
VSRPPATEESLAAVTVGELEPRTAPVAVVAYDPAWPELYAIEATRIRQALGKAALAVHHAGSTSIPGLAAKPVIDIVLVVEDSAREAGFAPALEAAGYALRIREPDWFEHRLFKRETPAVNLHVFSRDCAEIDRMLMFRDHLRENAADRELYQATKLDLARRDWKFTQNYADAKTEVVEAIIDRAAAARGR